MAVDRPANPFTLDQPVYPDHLQLYAEHAERPHLVGKRVADVEAVIADHHRPARTDPLRGSSRPISFAWSPAVIGRRIV